jgi:hypothetical protein
MLEVEQEVRDNLLRAEVFEYQGIAVFSICLIELREVGFLKVQVFFDTYSANLHE